MILFINKKTTVTKKYTIKKFGPEFQANVRKFPDTLGIEIKKKTSLHPGFARRPAELKKNK